MRNHSVDLSKAQDNLKTNGQVIVNPKYKTAIYKYEEILKELTDQDISAKDFRKDMYNKEASRFKYEIACIVMIPLLTIAAIVFYFLRFDKFVLLISILLFALIVPTYVILGLNASHFILSIDLCQDLNKYITADMNPVNNKGIGKYVSCPSKNTLFLINTAKYDLGESFNVLIKNINDTMIVEKPDIPLGPFKRDNEYFGKLQKFFSEEKNPRNDLSLSKKLYSLINTNQALESLDALSQCQFAENVINYTEEQFCYKNISTQFTNLFMYFFASLGLIMLTTGVNKLVVLLNPTLSKKKVKLKF